MVILSANALEMAFGEDILFKDVSFDISSDEKIGLVGINGTGKTTLFKLLVGDRDYVLESGNISKSSGLKIGYMQQHVIRDSSVSVYDEAVTVFSELAAMEKRLDEIHSRIDLEANVDNKLLETQMQLQEGFERGGGLTYRNRTRSALQGLGFSASDLEKPVNVLSGGEKSKLQLAKLLLSDVSLLLLDEPTNHLDITASAWLERFLQDYRGAFVVISHDRYFLDKVTEKTMELENKKLTCYKGNYTTFLQKKEEAREAMQKKYELTMAEIKRIEGIIEQQKRFNQAHNYVTIAHKQKSIDRLEAELVKPEAPPDELKFNFRCKDGSGNDALSTEKLALTLGGKLLFKDVDIEIKRRERIFLLGANGTGKTSLFKIITGNYQPNLGKVRFGARIELGYYDQIQNHLDDEKTVIDQIWDVFPKMTQTEIRTALGQFLFKNDDVFKKTSMLSGGEKARISLLLLMLKGSNLLLLDEPTNHLDISSREALEGALSSYPGTLFIISHDRYLINKLADRIYELDEGGVTEYAGNYDYYLSRKENNATEAVKTSETKKPDGNVNEYKQKKERESELRRLEGKLSRQEKLIEELEAKQAEINNQLILPENAGDYEKIMSLTEKLGAVNEQLEATTEEWAVLAESVERFK